MTARASAIRITAPINATTMLPISPTLEPGSKMLNTKPPMNAPMRKVPSLGSRQILVRRSYPEHMLSLGDTPGGQQVTPHPALDERVERTVGTEDEHGLNRQPGRGR